ncbi:MAG: Cna B-type domain-containing protein, partial [Clostridia bacterium]|nr:Cna B-type domain-containing protein [Clostridia bacterium]
SISGGKTWDDANNQDGKRPASITINLLANGKEVAEVKVTAENGWKYSFNNLPKYEDGKLIVYTITEDAVAGYTTTINGYNVTNTHTPETTYVSGGKTWNDANNQDGKRPASITINLLANGKEVAEVKVTGENGWKYSFNNLPKYEDGKLITYTITEDAVAGYTTTINGYNVTNTYTPEKIFVPVIKVWDDDDNSDGYRPASITVDLFANGVKIDSKVITVVDDWKYMFADLPKYENGVEIVYTIAEVEVEYYDSYIEGNMAEGFVITNTYVVEIPDTPPPLDPPPATGDSTIVTISIMSVVTLLLAAFAVASRPRRKMYS